DSRSTRVNVAFTMRSPQVSLDAVSAVPGIDELAADVPAGTPVERLTCRVPTRRAPAGAGRRAARSVRRPGTSERRKLERDRLRAGDEQAGRATPVRRARRPSPGARRRSG